MVTSVERWPVAIELGGSESSRGNLIIHRNHHHATNDAGAATSSGEENKPTEEGKTAVANANGAGAPQQHGVPVSIPTSFNLEYVEALMRLALQ